MSTINQQVRIHDKTSRVLLGRGSNAQKLLKAQEKLKKVNGGRTDGPTDRVTYRVACTRLKSMCKKYVKKRVVTDNTGVSDRQFKD